MSSFQKEHSEFIGPIGEYVKRVSPFTEADPHAIFLTMLAIFGCHIGRGAKFVIGATDHYPILYVLIIGESSRSRKGTTWGVANLPFIMMFPDWYESNFASGLSSGEGLIERLKNVNPLLVFESEFGSALKSISRDGNKLAQVLRDIWDCPPHVSIMNREKNSISAADPTLVMISHVTKDELMKLFKASDISGGTGNRILYHKATRSQKLSKSPDIKQIIKRDMVQLLDDLRAAIEFGRVAGEIRFSDEADRLWDRYYQGLPDYPSSNFANLTTRSEVQVIRLSLILALTEKSLEIKTHHLGAAIDIIDKSERAVLGIYDFETGDKDADKVLAAFKNNCFVEITRTQINHEVFSKNLTTKKLDEIAKLLNSLNLIEVCHRSNLAGPNTEVWIPTLHLRKLIEK